MSFDKYVSKFFSLREEIDYLITEKNLIRAFNILKNNEKSSWEFWIDQHKDDIFEFISRTELKRNKKRFWKDEEERCLFLTATLVCARRAYLFAKKAREALNLEGMSYRVAFSSSAEFADQLYDEFLFLWPFSGEDPWGGYHEFDTDYFSQSFSVSLDGENHEEPIRRGYRIFRREE